MKRVTVALLVLLAVSFPRNPKGQQLGAQAPANAARVPSALIVLYPYGFVPKEVRVSAGRVFLSIHSRLGLLDLTLRLDREQGNRIHEFQLSPRAPAWRKFTELTPGTYFLTEARHPSWVCRIIVNPSNP